VSGSYLILLHTSLLTNECSPSSNFTICSRLTRAADSVATLGAGPFVCLVQRGARPEHLLALVGQAGHIRELVAVELEDAAQLALLRVLPVQALVYIFHVHRQLLNARFVVQRHLMVRYDAVRVASNLRSVRLLVVLRLRDRVVQLHHLDAEGLDRDDLIGVDVELLLVSFLIGRSFAQIEVLHGRVVVFGHDGACVAAWGRQRLLALRVCLGGQGRL